MTPRERLLEKIRKVARLAENAGTDGEAQAAALAMQRLMAENDIDISEIDVNDEPSRQEVEDVTAEVLTNRVNWQERLLMVIARNFRCEMYISSGDQLDAKSGNWKKRTAYRLVGMTDDVAMATECYKATAKAADRLYRTYIKARKEADYADGLPQWSISQGHRAKNAYLDGFVNGLSRAFHEQVEANRQQAIDGGVAAIVLVKPQDVVKRMESMNLRRASRSHANGYGDGHARAAGAADGHSYGRGNAIGA